MGRALKHTALSERLLRRHLRPFPIGELIEAHRSHARGLGDYYTLATTRGRFVLRVLSDAKKRSVRFEQQLLSELLEQGLCVPRMVAAGTLGMVLPLAERQYLSVFQPQPGRVLATFELKLEEIRQVGAFLADMHLVAHGPRYGVDPMQFKKTMSMLENVALQTREASLLRDLRTLGVELTRTHAAQPRDEDLPHGTIHGQLGMGSARFLKGTLAGVSDFEQARFGVFAYDLALTLLEWCFVHDRLVPERARALVQGYLSRRVLNANERAALFDLCRYASAAQAILTCAEFEKKRDKADQVWIHYRDYRHYVARLESLKAVGPQLFREQLLGRKSSARASR